jgi:hypothetical protein
MGPDMYSGLTRDICAQAWNMITPAIAAADSMNVINKHAGTIFVLKPTRIFSGEPKLPMDVVLFGDIVGDIETPSFTKIAEAMAFVSWATGLSSRAVQQQAPHLYLAGMTKQGGSVVRDGLTIAFCGAQDVYSEMIAGWMADAIIAICRNEMTRPDGMMSSEGSFVGVEYDNSLIGSLGQVALNNKD